MTAAPEGGGAPPSRPFGWVVAAALVLHHVLAVAAFGVARVDGALRFLCDDDMLISMRYARNIARGLGPVFNPGERVEGFTNPLSTLVGVLLHVVGVAGSYIPLALDIVNLGASLAIVALLLRVWGRERSGLRAGLAAAALYVLSGQHLFYAHAGYEVYLQAALLLYGLGRFERIAVPGALLFGLLPLTHATSAVSWLVLVAAMLAFHEKPPRHRLLLAAAATAPLVVYEIFRVTYYADWLPNTYYLKAAAGKLTGGLSYTRAWLHLVLPAAVLALPALVALLRAWAHGGMTAYLRRQPADRPLVAFVVLGAHVGAVVMVGGDYFPLSRFLFPCTVLVAALAGRGVVAVLDGTAPGLPRWLVGRVAKVALGATAALAVLWPLVNYRANVELVAGRRDWNVHHLVFGEAIAANTPPDTKLALFALGYAGYFGDRAAIDMLGKADRHIARRPANPRRAIAHNKTDFDYVLARRPDLVELAIAPAALSDVGHLDQENRTAPHGYQAELALNPQFRSDWAPHPVEDSRGRPIRLYARMGTEEKVPVRWRISEAYFEAEAP